MINIKHKHIMAYKNAKGLKFEWFSYKSKTVMEYIMINPVVDVNVFNLRQLHNVRIMLLNNSL